MQGRGTGEETRSIWMTEPLPRFAPLAGDRQVDVAVIGAGITGPHHRLAAEAPGPAGGGDRGGRGRQRRDLAHQRPPDGGAGRAAVAPGVALRAGQRRRGRAGPPGGHRLDRHDRRATLGIDCDFQRVPGLPLLRRRALPADGADGRSLLDAEAEAAAELGLPVRRVPAAPLPFATGPALRFEQPGAVSSAPLPAGTGGRAGQRRQRGVRAHPGAVGGGRRALPGRDRSGNGHGERRGGRVARASGEQGVPAHQARTDAQLPAGAVDRPASPGRACSGTSASPYHYWRSVRIDGQDLMLVGGGDHKVGETEDTEAAFRELEDVRAPAAGPCRSSAPAGRARSSNRWTGWPTWGATRCPPTCSWPPATRATG